MCQSRDPEFRGGAGLSKTRRPIGWTEQRVGLGARCGSARGRGGARSGAQDGARGQQQSRCALTGHGELWTPRLGAASRPVQEGGDAPAPPGKGPGFFIGTHRDLAPCVSLLGWPKLVSAMTQLFSGSFEGIIQPEPGHGNPQACGQIVGSVGVLRSPLVAGVLAGMEP